MEAPNCAKRAFLFREHCTPVVPLRNAPERTWSRAGSVFHSLRAVVVRGVRWDGGKGNYRALVPRQRLQAPRAIAMEVCGVCIANCQWQIADETLAGGGRHMSPPQDTALRFEEPVKAFGPKPGLEFGVASPKPPVQMQGESDEGSIL